MPIYHLHADYIKKGHGSAAGLARYMACEDRGEASKLHRYIERDSHGWGKEDLIARGSGNLPAWAQGSADLFWQAADTLERKNGDVARTYEIALPRELSPQGREDLAADIRAVLMGTQYVHAWAIHEPQDRDGSGIMPHLHLMFSPRRQDDAQAWSMETWFRQVNHGGVQVEASWKTKGRLYDVRAAVALLTNAALAREGLLLAVDHRTLEAQGLSRDPARYTAGDTADQARTMAYRQQLTASGVKAFEQIAVFEAWKGQARGLHSPDRQYTLDLARDHVWRFDQSPARQQERHASQTRTQALLRGERRPSHQLVRPQDDSPGRGPARQPTVPPPTPRTPQVGVEVAQFAARVAALAAALQAQQQEQGHGAPLRVRLHDREQGLGFSVP